MAVDSVETGIPKWLIVTAQSIENLDVIDYGSSPAQSWQAFRAGRAGLCGWKQVISSGEH